MNVSGISIENPNYTNTFDKMVVPLFVPKMLTYVPCHNFLKTYPYGTLYTHPDYHSQCYHL